MILYLSDYWFNIEFTRNYAEHIGKMWGNFARNTEEMIYEDDLL